MGGNIIRHLGKDGAIIQNCSVPAYPGLTSMDKLQLLSNQK